MSRVRTKLRFAILLAVVLAACTTRPPARLRAGPTVTPSTCAADTAAVFVVITNDVDSLTAQNYLATAPFGQCVLIASQRVPPIEARDFLDASIAMLITSTPEAMAYANTRQDLESTPLPWDRVYALVVADSTSSLLPDGSSALDSLRADLARDVVRGDARAATTPPCGHPTASNENRLTTIGYPAGDATARSIAARLAAIGNGLRVVSHNPAGSAAYMTSFAVGDTTMCELSAWVVPLVETRARAITPVSAAARP